MSAQTKFYTFCQNNSGGSFDESAEVGKYVIVEAVDALHANARAELLGIYFDGCSTGHDCSCCGDRWYRADERDGFDQPIIYGEPAETYKPEGLAKIMGTASIRIYRMDNSIQQIEASP